LGLAQNGALYVINLASPTASVRRGYVLMAGDAPQGLAYDGTRWLVAGGSGALWQMNPDDPSDTSGDYGPIIGTVEILSSDAASNSVTVRTAGRLKVGDRVRFAEDERAELLGYLDDPAAVARYGPVSGVMRRKDLSGASNELLNADLSAWTGGKPDDWTVDEFNGQISIPLGAPDTSMGAASQNWRDWRPNVRVDSRAVEGGAAAWLGLVQSRNVETTTVWLTVRLAASPPGSGYGDRGPDLLSVFETGGSLEFREAGGASLTLNMADALYSDVAEPYTWRFLGNAAAVAFFAGLSGSSDVTLVIHIPTTTGAFSPVERVTDSSYEIGAASCRYSQIDSDAMLRQSAALVLKRDDPYATAVAYVTLLTRRAAGGVKLELRGSGAVAEVIGSRVGSVMRLACTSTVPQADGTFHLRLSGTAVGVVFVVHGAMLVPSSGIPASFVSSPAGNRLWPLAQRVLKQRADPVERVDIGFVDRHRVDPVNVPFGDVVVGVRGRVTSPDLDADLTRRVLGRQRNYVIPGDSRVLLADAKVSEVDRLVGGGRNRRRIPVAGPDVVVADS